MNMRNYRFLQTIIALIVFWGCQAPPKDLPLEVVSGKTMGTTFMVKYVPVVNGKQELDVADIERKINEKLFQVDKIEMSTYSKDSELSRFNTSTKTDWIDVSPNLYNVLRYAQEINSLSDGAFDATIGPVVNLWGFGAEKREKSSIPSEKEIGQRKALTGMKKIEFQESGERAIRKAIPELYCDLSAIAKGFSVDQVGKLLEGYGIHNYMVEVGGEVRARGTNQRRAVWRIGISTPDESRGISKVIRLDDRAVATSGDYLNYFEKNGVRYSHMIDPRVGKPITHKLASVTVVHENCMNADALATAINVMGPEKGYEFAARENLAVFMLVRSEDGFEEKMTPAFSAIFSKKQVAEK